MTGSLLSFVKILLYVYYRYKYLDRYFLLSAFDFRFGLVLVLVLVLFLISGWFYICHMCICIYIRIWIDFSRYIYRWIYILVYMNLYPYYPIIILLSISQSEKLIITCNK